MAQGHELDPVSDTLTYWQRAGYRGDLIIMETLKAFSDRYPSPSTWYIPSSAEVQRSQQAQGRGGASSHLPVRQARAILDQIKVVPSQVARHWPCHCKCGVWI